MTSLIVCGLLGLIIGSFLNVVIHRLPIMMEREWRVQCAELAGKEPEPQERYDLIVPRSRCPKCDHRISALENVPVISWLVLRGRCRGCHAPISIRYPLVELTAGAMGVIAAGHYEGMQLYGALAFSWALLAAAVIDLDHKLLPDDITLPLLWLGLLFGTAGVFLDARQAIVGAAVGYLSLWSVYQLFRLVTGKEGMGHGDFKLLGALGAWLGWKQLPLVIVGSSVLGAVIGGALMLVGRGRRDDPIPFGPFLALAGYVALYWGTPITHAWLQLLRP